MPRVSFCFYWVKNRECRTNTFPTPGWNPCNHDHSRSSISFGGDINE